MLKDLTIGQYLPIESPVHRLDPRTKILLTLVFLTAVFFVPDFRGYYILTAFTILAILAARLPIRFVLRGLRPVVFLLLITVILNFFLTPGEPLWKIGPLTATREGVRQGLLMGYRLLLLIVTASLLTLTTSPISLTDGLERLLRPFQRFGVPAHELAMMMTIALRFIPTLTDEADRILKAQMARGADFGSGNVLNRAKALIPLLVPLFVSAFRRADELATAMESRCYRGGEGRSRMKQLRVGFGDAVAVLVTVAFLAAAVVGTRVIG